MTKDERDAVQTYAEQVLAKALARYDERVGTPFPRLVKMHTVDDDDFGAFAYLAGDVLNIDLAAGTLWQVTDVWDQALELSDTLPAEQQIILLGHRDHAIETSIQWLLQHEMNHMTIGHFDLLDGAGLSQGRSRYGFGIASRDAAPVSPMDFLKPEERPQAPLCLELQTDHDATEIVLGAYTAENWFLYRYYAICVLVIILIIEAQEREAKNANRSHPDAATRLFMLIGYLVEMSTIPGIKRAYAEGLNQLPASYLPSVDELSA